MSLPVAQVGATIIAVYLGGHFLATWVGGIRHGPAWRPIHVRRRLFWLGVVVAITITGAVVAVIWS